MSRKFDVSPHFKKMLRSKSPESQKRVKAAMKRILEDDRSGGLRLKPMQGWQGIWEARVSKSLRITYEYGDEDSIFFRKNCEHDTVLSSP